MRRQKTFNWHKGGSLSILLDHHGSLSRTHNLVKRRSYSEFQNKTVYEQWSPFPFNNSLSDNIPVWHSDYHLRKYTKPYVFRNAIKRRGVLTAVLAVTYIQLLRKSFFSTFAMDNINTIGNRIILTLTLMTAKQVCYQVCFALLVLQLKEL